MCPICAHWARVCLLQHGYTPLMWAAGFSKSPGIVEALVHGKANLEAISKVRHLEDNRCVPYVFIGHACVRCRMA